MVKRLFNFLFDDTSSLSVGRLMVKGITWLMIGVLVGRLAMFATRIIAARILGKVPLGEFGLIESTVSMFVAYAGLGMGVAVSKNLAECCRIDAPRAGRILGTVCLLSGSLFVVLLLALFLSSKGLAASLSPNPDFLASLRIGMLLSLLVPAALAMAILNAFQAFRHVTFANVIQGLACLFLTLILAPIWGLNGYLLAFGGGLLLMVIYQGVIILSLCQEYNIQIRLKGMTQELPLIWRYGLPSMLSGVLIGPVTWATRALLAKQADGLGELGLYVAAFSLSSIFIAVSTLLYNVTVPILSSATNQEEKQAGIRRSIFLYWLAAIGLGLPMIALANHLTKFVLGPEFTKAGPILAIVSLAVGIRIFSMSFGSLLIVMDRVWHMALSTVAGEPIFLGLTFFLAPLWGAQGLALAYLISGLVTLILSYSISAREMAWGRLPQLGLILTIALIGAAWLINGIATPWLAMCSTILLLGLYAITSIYLAFRYDLLGGLAARVPFGGRNR